MMLCTGAPKADTLARLTNVHQPLHGGSLAQTGSVYGLPERVTLQWPHEPCPSQVIRIVLPCDGPPSRRTRAQSCEPPNDEQPSSGPSQSHVQPAAVGEKAEGTSSIIPHCGNNTTSFCLPSNPFTVLTSIWASSSARLPRALRNRSL